MKQNVLKATAIALLTTTAMIMTAKTTDAATKIVKLRVVETTDVHGCFFPYDFMEKRPMKGSLMRVNTYIQQLRREYGDRLLLMDNGDILQGQPASYWSNYVANDRENIAASMINYMGYDCETVGNHDIETGHAVYDKWISEVKCPMLGANIIDRKTGRPYLPPYIVFNREGVKIAVIGMLTPAIPNWLNESVWKGLEFQEMLSCARKWIHHLKEVEHCDLVIGLFHSGRSGGILTTDYAEDASEAMAREVPGFDIVFFGHDHKENCFWVENTAGQQVLCINPSCWARKVADVRIELTIRDGRLVNKDIKGELVDVSDIAIDEQMLNKFQTQMEEIKKYVERPIGTFRSSISTRDCYLGNSAFSDLIHNLQLKISKADISFNAPLSFNSTIQAGPVTVSDMFKLYRFENLLYVLNMTGREIHRHLEMSYELWTNQMKSPDDHIMLLDSSMKGEKQRMSFKNYTFNFDSACGIDYEVDVTKPAGEKVRILRMSDGTPFDEKKWYKVVMNSYRGNGGGELLTHGAGIPKDSIDGRIIFQSELDQRYYLMKEIERMGTVDPQPNHNWRFVPEEWAKPALKRDSLLLFGDSH